MRILVTGSSGFIGTALMSALAANTRLHVRVAARRAGLVLPAGIELARIEAIGPDTRWNEALAGIEVVIHLAARAHVLDEALPDALAEYRRVNTAGTLALARQAAATGVRRFIFLSTVKVNGESTLPGHPFTVADTPAPVDPYAISKREAEDGLRAIAAGTGMEAVIIRPPLVYGPGVKGNFARLIAAIGQGRWLPLGAIDNRRSLVSVDNLVDLLLKCINHTAAADQTLLVSDGEDLSTPALIRCLSTAMGRPAHLLPMPVTLLKAGAVLTGRRAMMTRLIDSLQVDISATRRLLDWMPPLSIDEGMRRIFRN